jgi:hypothetical protein
MAARDGDGWSCVPALQATGRQPAGRPPFVGASRVRGPAPAGRPAGQRRTSMICRVLRAGDRPWAHGVAVRACSSGDRRIHP